MSDDTRNIPQSIIVEDRKKATVGGVLDVNSMDENMIVLETVLGELTIKGTDLRIISFSGETGDLMMSGMITAMAYTGDGSKRGGFFSRMLK